MPWTSHRGGQPTSLERPRATQHLLRLILFCLWVAGSAVGFSHEDLAWVWVGEDAIGLFLPSVATEFGAAVHGGVWPMPLPLVSGRVPAPASHAAVDPCLDPGADLANRVTLAAGMADLGPDELTDPARGPPILADPADNAFDLAGERTVADPLLRYPMYPPAGFTGSSSVVPSEEQETSHFVPIEDRWRIGLQPWDRYGRGHPRLEDYPYALGNGFNPYTQNLLKEDYPLIGQETFFNMAVISR
ncbi:MAG: hypothetical protein ACKO6B_04755, partial [Planctomycetia bacterium]